MRARHLLVAVLLLAGCSSGSGGSSNPTTTPSTAAKGSKANAGPAELVLRGHAYDVADPLPEGEAGELIATRSVPPTKALGDARRTQLLYHSLDHRGRDSAVSGVLLVPPGTAPKGGWPLVSWAHGTTGVADVCAPSTTPNLFYNEYAQEARSFLDAGYAVVATDYHGLATPGVHGYMVGDEEGNAVVDAAAAAHQADPSVGTTWFAVGHSEGGQAALFATKVPLRGARTRPAAAVAIAPANSLELALPAVAHGDAPADVVYGAYMIAGLGTVDPSVHLADELGAEGRKHQDLILEDGCLLDSYDALDPEEVHEIFAMTDERAQELSERIARYGDPERHGVDGPVLVVQGAEDLDVPAAITRNMVAGLEAKGDEVTYQEVPGRNHDQVVGPTICDQLDFLAAHGGVPAPGCTPHETDMS